MSDSTEVSDQKSAPENRETHGPFDVEELSEVRPFIDFGSIQIVPDPAIQLKLEVDEGSKRVVAISVEVAESKLQLQAFASPRSSGLWNEIREQLNSQIRGQGGEALIEEGEVGLQLTGNLSAQSPDGQTVKQLVRFLGVDGPRWFLRGVVTGRALNDPDAWAQVLKVYRGVTVVRGNTPMPPRELLPLKLPANPDQPNAV